MTALAGAGCNAPGNASLTVKSYYTKTPDGITLALRRYQPGQLSSDKDPVILCHGLSYNQLFWDLKDEVSLARYLSQSGYDVWSLSLRGACPSSQPLTSALRKLGHFNLEPQVLLTLRKRWADMKMTDWSVDDHIDHDVPTAISFVRAETGRRQVHWIGHSMGGMIMFAYLGQQNPKVTRQIKSFVAAAVPMAVFHPLSKPFRFLLEAKKALKIGSKIVGSSAPAAAGAIFGDINTPMDKLFYNSSNMDDNIIRTMFQKAQEEISPSQFKQLLDMVRNERFRSLNKKVDYTAVLPAVTVPTCFLVGTVDNMATPGAVRFAYRQIHSSDKQFFLFGRVNSHRRDYGHDDIILGKHARQEVYPTILDWLDQHKRKPHEDELMLQPARN